MNAFDAAGNVWVANNWDMPSEGFKKVPDPALATRFGGNAEPVSVLTIYTSADPPLTSSSPATPVRPKATGRVQLLLA